jgi:hypothetical protein
MWNIIVALLLFLSTCAAQNVTVLPSGSGVQYIGAGWQIVDNAAACGPTPGVVGGTAIIGDSMEYRFEGGLYVRTRVVTFSYGLSSKSDHCLWLDVNQRI